MNEFLENFTDRSARDGRRPRRLRRTAAIRSLVRETTLEPARLVMPLFLVEGGSRVEPIEAIPGCARFSIDTAIRESERAMAIGIRAVALFPRIESDRKTPSCDEAVRDDTLIVRAIEQIKHALPELCLISDVALDPYSTHGHDGLVINGEIANDETVELLAQMSTLHAQAGADLVAPSDMMDGRIRAIRTCLDSVGFSSVGILSYAVKYASSFYGPFRLALDSAPVPSPDVPGDKSTYQMDIANWREALREARLDEDEGADILMIKPGLPCLDIIHRVRDATHLPLAAYHVSGEYAMLRAAADRGWIDWRRGVCESLLSLRRAGADMIFTYAAMDYAGWWREAWM